MSLTDCTPCSETSTPTCSTSIVEAGKYAPVLDQYNRHFGLKPKPCAILHHASGGSNPVRWATGSQNDRICLDKLYGPGGVAVDWFVGMDSAGQLQRSAPVPGGTKKIPVAQGGSITWNDIGESSTWFAPGVIGTPGGTCSRSIAAFFGCESDGSLKLGKLPATDCGYLKGNGDIGNPVPAGVITMWGGTFDDVPEGYAACDGRLLSPTTYPTLYAAIGFNFGRSGSLFATPDMRGVVPRGVDTSGAKDPDGDARTESTPGSSVGRYPGSYQEDALQDHKHLDKSITAIGTSSTTVGSTPSGSITYVKTITSGLADTDGYVIEVDDVRLSEETRMKNLYVNFIISTGCE